MLIASRTLSMPEAEDALPGREQPLEVEDRHYVHGRPIKPPFPANTRHVLFGMGCFWGTERLFWSLPGVYTTAVGYAGGYTPNPTYDEVCSGMTGHTEVALVVYEPDVIALEQLLALFWESHDPTQVMRQGNDQGTQYRSAIYCENEQQLLEAKGSRDHYAEVLADAGRGAITTEIELSEFFYYAETYHQQYLAKHPHGYCGLMGTGVRYSA